MKKDNWSKYLLLQINIICLLLFLLGVTVISRHLGWFH